MVEEVVKVTIKATIPADANNTKCTRTISSFHSTDLLQPR